MKEKKITIKIEGDGRVLCPICRARINDDMIFWIHKNCGNSFLEIIKKLMKEQEGK